MRILDRELARIKMKGGVKASELLAQLRSLGVKVWVEGAELKISAPKGVLTGELREALKAKKSDLLSMLAPVDGDRQRTITRVSREGALPLSSSQARLWFLDQLEPGLTAYNMWVGVSLSGALNQAALERSLTHLLERHEGLRARYAEGPTGPVQSFSPVTPVALEVVDCCAPGACLEGESAREAGTRHLLARIREPYDLARGPLYRFGLARVGVDEHLFLLGMHHSVSDGLSLAILIRELLETYAAFSRGAESTLGEPLLQYGDYAVWQNEFLESPEFERQLSYWCERLSGELPVLEFPVDKARPAVQSYEGGSAGFDLDMEALRRFSEFTKSEGATFFMGILALYKMLIRRFTGVEDVLVGTPIANRSRSELDAVVGFFSNTVVMRSDLSQDPSFRELLASVRDTCLSAFEHQDMPFERLVDELQPERNLAYTPIFQTLFMFEEIDRSKARMGDLELEYLDLPADMARMDVTFGVVRGPDSAVVFAEYRTDLYEPETIQRMLAGFSALMHGALKEPDAPLSRLALMTDADAESILVSWNDTSSSYRRDSSIIAEFEARVSEAPGDVAAVFASPDGKAQAQELTYGELNERANRIAHRLIELGVGPDDLVGLCSKRTLEMLVGIVGILKAGGAYVPLDPGYPEDRLRFMVEDAGLELILVADDVADALPESDCRVLSLQSDDPADAASHNPELRSGARNLAYVMFTSGSTGRPKGVCVEQRSVLRLVMDPNFIELGREQVLLHFAPISFDASTLEVWGALLRGGRMVVFPPTEPSLEALGAVIKDYGVTTAWLTSGLFSLMVDHRLEDLRGVRQLLAGGDVLPVPQVNRVLRELPDLCLVNGYGPTENTTFACCHRISDHGEVEGSVPIGQPISDTQVFVLNRSLLPAPVGVPGDLYIGGHGVARGYLHREELTAERFLPNPFDAEEGARMYATGDRVRWRADGTLEFLGRLDDQVKVRGFRIELGEIETVLGTHPLVRACSVIVREDIPGDKRIVAYMVAEAGADSEEEPSSKLLREYLGTRIPEYMIPAHYVTLDALPLAPTGKVDKKALPAPDPARDVEASYAPPSNEAERKMALIWQSVLGVERVGIHDNFFELGGNSLLSTQAISRVRSEFDVELPLRRLFEAPTVAGLALFASGGSAADIAGRSYEDVHDRCLIPLQPKGWKRPVFIVSGAHAHEDGFLRFVGSLLPHMEKDQPIYGFKARGLDGVSQPHGSAAAMAADYLAEMRELQPEGPYFLVGNCVGGIVAFEMAQQLKAAGQEVGLLALLDTTAPVASYREFVAEHYRFWKLSRFRAHWRNMGDLSTGEKLSYFTSRLRKRLLHLFPMSEEVRRKNHVEDVERKYSQILARYEPKALDGKLTIIVNEEFEREMPDAGWTPWAKNLEIHVSPGDHVTRLSENAGPVADILKQCIRRAAGEEPLTQSAAG